MSHNADEIYGYGTTSGDNLWAVYDSNGTVKGYIDISGNFTAVGTLNGAGGTITSPTLVTPTITGLMTAASATFSSTLAVTGATTLTGGLVATGSGPGVLPKAFTIPIGAVAYGSLGTDSFAQANKCFVASIVVPRNCTLTGVGILQGTASATDKFVVELFSSAGALLANSNTAGVVANGVTDSFQEVAFTATYAAVGPALYYVGIQTNGTTTKIRTITASTYLGVATQLATQTFGTPAAITAPTTFTTVIGPIAYLY